MIGGHQNKKEEIIDIAHADGQGNGETLAIEKEKLKKKVERVEDEKKIGKVTNLKLERRKKRVSPLKSKGKKRLLRKKDDKHTDNDRDTFKEIACPARMGEEHNKKADTEGNVYCLSEIDHSQDQLTEKKLMKSLQRRGHEKNSRVTKLKLPPVFTERDTHRRVGNSGQVLMSEPEEARSGSESFTNDSEHHSLDRSDSVRIVGEEANDSESQSPSLQESSSWAQSDMVGAFRVRMDSSYSDDQSHDLSLIDNSTIVSIGTIQVEAHLVDQEAEEANIRIAIENLQASHREELHAALENERQLAIDLEEKAHKIRRQKKFCAFSIATIIIIVIVSVTVVVSMTKNNINKKADHFPQTDGRWIQIGSDIIIHSRKLGNDYDESNQMGETGVKLSADGNRLAISAPFKDEGPLLDNGRVEVYELENIGNWKRIGYIISETSTLLGSMIDLSIDGNFVALARASLENSSSCEQSSDPYYFFKYVSVFHFDGSNWVQVGNKFHGMCNRWGITFLSMSENGTYVAVSGQGSIARVYENKHGTWTEKGKRPKYHGGGWISLTRDGKRLLYNDYTSGQAAVYDFKPYMTSNRIETLPPTFGDDDTVAKEKIVEISDDGAVIAIGSSSSNIIENSLAEHFEDFIVVYNKHGQKWRRLGANFITIETILVNVPRTAEGLMMTLSGDGSSIATSYAMKDGDKVELIIGVVKYSKPSNKWTLVGDSISWPENFSDDNFVPFLSLSHDGKSLAVSVVGITRVYRWESKK